MRRLLSPADQLDHARFDALVRHAEPFQGAGREPRIRSQQRHQQMLNPEVAMSKCPRLVDGAGDDFLRRRAEPGGPRLDWCVPRRRIALLRTLLADS